MAGNIASASFPPASTISQALVFVLGACKNVSDEYDQIAGFYETVIIFCERLSLLQERMPLQNAFRSQLVALLGTILNMCGIAQTITGKGRMLTFTKTLIQSDDGLAGAYDEFNNQMSHFESAIITATLGISVQTGMEVEILQEMSRETQSLLRTVLSRVSTLPRREIVFGAKGDYINDSECEYRGSSPRGNKSNNTAYENKLTDLGQRRFSGLEGTLKRFSTGSELSLRQHLAEMGYAYVQNTCVWLHETEDFKKFKEDRSGKHFTFQDMISCCALQFAMQDNKYRKRLVEALKEREDNKQDNEQDNKPDNKLDICQCIDKHLTNHLCPELFFQIAFDKTEEFKNTRMFLVIDGANIEKTKINDELKKILSHPEVSFASNNSEEIKQPNNTKLGVIDLTFKTRRGNVIESNNDLKIFAKSRLQTLQRLSMLAEYRKTIIIDEVCSKADSFPYIQHTLHRLNNSARLKVQWGKLPESTYYIYEQLFSGHHSVKRYQQRRKILIWLAYAKHPFSLGAIRRLHGWIKEGTIEEREDIDIDDELDGPLSG
ncbi:hypothetical protein VE02_04808 [Pseudogymnoascus sp. 03VT05]|nr:hypothetical protein VE02_04808 [Pseudogymnoascus sp. 03VT05]